MVVYLTVSGMRLVHHLMSGLDADSFSYPVKTDLARDLGLVWRAGGPVRLGDRLRSYILYLTELFPKQDTNKQINMTRDV